MLLIRTLLRPADYLAVRHSAKRRLDAGAIVLGLLIGTLIWLLRSFNVIGAGGLVSGIGSLFENLLGFYIAALAVVATFDGMAHGYDMDQRLIGEDAILIGVDGTEEALSRRRLLALMFGYLAMSTLFAYVFGLIATLVAPLAHRFWSPIGVDLARGIFSSIYAVWVCHVFGTTLLGLYFLSHRMPRSPREDGFRPAPYPAAPPTQIETTSSPTIH